jgi:hypothetical protein
MRPSELSEMRSRVTALRDVMQLLSDRLKEQREMVERLSRAAGSSR